MLGEVFVHSARDHDPRQAAGLFERVAALDADNLAYVDLPFTYGLLGELEKAHELVRRTEARQPAVAREQEAFLFALEGRPEEALRLPATTNPIFRQMRLMIALQASRWDLAREIASRDPGRGSLRAWGLRGRADLHAYLGEFDAAAAAYEEAGGTVGYRPDEQLTRGGVPATALEALADLLQLKGDFPRALQEAERSLGIQPESPRAQFFAGLAAVRASNLPVAEKRLDALQKLVQRARATTGDLYRDALDAEIRLARGAAPDAVSLLERVMRSDRVWQDMWSCGCTSGAVFREGLARAYLAIGDRDKAATTLRPLVSGSFEGWAHPVVSVRALYTLGKLSVEGGDVAPGREYLKRFLAQWGKAGWDLPEVREARRLLAQPGNGASS